MIKKFLKLFGIFFLIFFSYNVYSLDGWQYYRQITINNTQNPNNLIDYQILVTLDTRTLISQGKMRSDCGDIRFTDSDRTTLLNYWVESGTCNTSNTHIWVKVPLIPGNSNKTIYLWYGNPNAISLSNGDLVFEFFDDFNGNTLDTSKWTVNGYVGFRGIFYNVSNSILTIWSDNNWRILRMNRNFGPNDMIVIEVKFSKTADSDWHTNFLIQHNSDNNRFGFVDIGYSGLNMGVYYMVNSINYYPKNFGLFSNNVWYISRIIKKNSTTLYVDALASNRTLINSYETIQSAWSSITWTWVTIHGGSTGYVHVRYDWIFVRKYTNPEPIVFVGPEYIDFYVTIITNNQIIPTPSPFQQQIAICNGTINIGPNFAYVNNPTLFNQIHPDGRNVYFTTNYGDIPNIYSWYAGQFIHGNTQCKIWWIRLDNEIPANGNITIYIAISDLNTNFYSPYYPYVGASPNVFPSRQYDNGRHVFIVYGYFNNTFDGWTGHIFYGLVGPTATSSGIQILSGLYNQGNYILPYNNWNIPLIPLIVEEAWHFTRVSNYHLADANIISLFGNTNHLIRGSSIGSTCGDVPASNSSTFVQFVYQNCFYPSGLAVMLKSAVTNHYLNHTSFSISEGTIYSYLIVNSTYAQAGYYIYSSNQVWVPLTLLNTYTINYNRHTYANLNYNPFRHGTLLIGAGTNGGYSHQFIQWVIARSYPPNGVMPSFSIIKLLTPDLLINTSTNFQFNVSIYNPFSEYVNYTVYLNSSILTTNNVSVNAFQALIIPYEFPYLFNQSGAYNLTVIAYGQTSRVTSISTAIFNIQLDQLNVTLEPYYTYNNVNYTNLYNSNLRITYYCMRPNNTLIIYNNITNRTLQINLSCNYIQTINNLMVNLTPILQNNTLNHINGSLLYGNQSFRNMSFMPLWGTLNVTLFTNIPGISIYTSPLSLNYSINVRDVLPNVVCNITLYDNNTIVQTHQTTLTNASSPTYSWTISQAPIHNLRWYIYCYNPVNLTYIIDQRNGTFYYNRFDFRMEDSGNMPSNISYSLSIACNNDTTVFRNPNMNTYTIYAWTNDQCGFILVSQNIQGIAYSMGYSTNLLSRYAYQWTLCLLNPSLAYFNNPLIGQNQYLDTLIALANPQAGCYLLGSYLYLYSSNVYYAPVPVRIGALYSIRVNNTFLTTVQGQQQQAISIDNLIAQSILQNNRTVSVIAEFPVINVTNISSNVYQLTVTAPARISSANIIIYYNDTLYRNHTINSIGTNNFTILLTELPENYTFNLTNYMIITITYENGFVQQMIYPPNVLNNRITLPAFMVYLIAIFILYAWTRAFSYYQRLIIAGFGLVLFLILMSMVVLQTTAPLVLAAGIFFLFLLDMAYTEFLSRFTGEHPLLKPLSFLIRMFIIMTFITSVVGVFFGPYGIYNLGIPTLNDYMYEVNNTINKINNTIIQMTKNPFFFVIGFIELAINLIYAISLGIKGAGVFISLFIVPLASIFGPAAVSVAQAIVSIVYFGAIIAILVYLTSLVFSAVGLRPF